MTVQKLKATVSVLLAKKNCSKILGEANHIYKHSMTLWRQKDKDVRESEQANFKKDSVTVFLDFFDRDKKDEEPKCKFNHSE
jgi:predicted secreted Zn-dependent protease